MTIAIRQITSNSIDDAVKWVEENRKDLDPNEKLLMDAAYVLRVLMKGPLREVHEAIHVEGKNPTWHRRTFLKHRGEWPSLWDPLLALDASLQDVHDTVVDL